MLAIIVGSSCEPMLACLLRVVCVLVYCLNERNWVGWLASWFASADWFVRWMGAWLDMHLVSWLVA